MISSSQPLVSVITPSYNQGQFLEHTILSVLNQDYANIEYLVIDGGSTDNSLEIIRRYADRLKYWESEPDRGQAHAINKGLKRAKGEVLSWLNSDDVLFPETVSLAVATFLQHDDIDVVYGRLIRIGPDGKPVPTPTLPKDRVEFTRHNVIGECVVNQPGAVWRQRIMKQTGYLNEKLNYALDYEYWVRMILAGGKFKKLPNPVAQFRLSSGSKTVGQTSNMAREHLKVIDHFMAQSDMPEKLGLSPEAVRRQAGKGRGIVSLYAFYGCVKEKQWSEALYWFRQAHASDPLVLLDRRWVGLAWASFFRRIFE